MLRPLDSRFHIVWPNPSLLLLVGVLVTLALFGLVIREALRAYGSYKRIESDELVLDRLDTELTSLDEALSVDALLSVATGDTSWNSQYSATEFQLDSAIIRAATVLDTVPTAPGLMQLRRLHARRVDTEQAAMQLAQLGEIPKAQKMLASNAYLLQKKAYIASIQNALQTLNDGQEWASSQLRQHLRLIAIFTGGVVMAAWLSIISVIQVNYARRKRTERILRESEARYRGLTDAAFDEVVLTENGIVIEASDKVSKLFGYEPRELRGMDSTALVAPEFRDIVRGIQVSGYERPYETVCVRKDGTRFPVEICGKTVPYHGRQARITALRDISERKRAEEERESLIGELEAKNDELERFSYTVSHDLKSPLITIKGFLKWIERDARESNFDRLRTNMGRVSNAADHMEQMMDAVLRLSRSGLSMDPPAEIPFGEIVHAAVELTAGRISERKVSVEIADHFPVVHGDRQRLLEVMLNLVDNAIKFMGDQPRPRVEIGCRMTDGLDPVIYVRDNGIGIEPAYQAQVLGLFQKLSSETEGSGVGLALVKRIAESHGGAVWVESQGRGYGSTFCVRFPMHESMRAKIAV